MCSGGGGCGGGGGWWVAVGGRPFEKGEPSLPSASSAFQQNESYKYKHGLYWDIQAFTCVLHSVGYFIRQRTFKNL
jgi:hypothetical protein